MFTLTAMRFNFEKYTSSKINDLGVGYDYESVMHYGAKAFSKDGRSLTISIKKGKTTNDIKLGQRYGLSDMDKKQARLLYNCNSELTLKALSAKYTDCMIKVTNILNMSKRKLSYIVEPYYLIPCDLI
jgi:hypothetical protein